MPSAGCSLSLKYPSSLRTAPSPFSYLANSYSSFRAQPTASSSKKPPLILSPTESVQFCSLITRYFSIPVTESTWRVEYGLSLNFYVSHFLMNTQEDEFVNQLVCLCVLLKAASRSMIVLLLRAKRGHPQHCHAWPRAGHCAMLGCQAHRLRCEQYPLEMDDMPA